MWYNQDNMYTWAYIYVQEKLVSIRVPCMYNRWKVEECSMISVIQGVNTKRWSHVTLIPLSPAATKYGICLRLSLFSQNYLQHQKKKNKQEGFFYHTHERMFSYLVYQYLIWTCESSEPFLPLHDISIHYTGTDLFGLNENKKNK